MCRVDKEVPVSDRRPHLTIQERIQGAAAPDPRGNRSFFLSAYERYHSLKFWVPRLSKGLTRPADGLQNLRTRT